jgi:hypothetical protein
MSDFGLEESLRAKVGLSDFIFSSALLLFLVKENAVTPDTKINAAAMMNFFMILY